MQARVRRAPSSLLRRRPPLALTRRTGPGQPHVLPARPVARRGVRRSPAPPPLVSAGRAPTRRSIYKGGRFVFTLEIPKDYPHGVPKVMCTTKVYHPNIDFDGAPRRAARAPRPGRARAAGNICLNILRADWKPVLNLQVPPRRRPTAAARAPPRRRRPSSRASSSSSCLRTRTTPSTRRCVAAAAAAAAAAPHPPLAGGDCNEARPRTVFAQRVHCDAGRQRRGSAVRQLPRALSDACWHTGAVAAGVRRRREDVSMDGASCPSALLPLCRRYVHDIDAPDEAVAVLGLELERGAVGSRVRAQGEGVRGRVRGRVRARGWRRAHLPVHILLRLLQRDVHIAVRSGERGALASSAGGGGAPVEAREDPPEHNARV